MSHFEEEDFKKEVDWALWLKIARLAMGQKVFIALLAATAIVLAVTESAFTMITRHVIDSIVAQGTQAPLASFVAQYAALGLTQVLCVLAFIILGGRISTNLSHHIRRIAFQKLQELSFSYFDRRPVGWLMARLTSDCSRLSDIIAWGMLDLVWCITAMSVISCFMLYMHWQLALLVLCVVPALFGASLWFKIKLLKTQREIKKLNSQITASYNEGIVGVRTTKSMVREDENLKDFTGLTSSMAQASIRNAITSALYMPVVMLLGSVGVALALWRGGLATLEGSITLGTLVAFINYARGLFDPIAQMASILTQAQAAQASGERLMSLLEEVPEIKDSAEVQRAIEEQKAQGLRRGIAIDGRRERIKQVEFRQVSFAYKGGKPVLRDFNLTVEAGQTIALVGPTGGGKSTIVSLLCRFYEPTEGKVLVNGTDYRYRSLHWLQSNLGMVLQTPHLFNGSVMDNLRYGRLEASDDEVMAASKLVNAHEFIMGLEQGYQTQVGEGGGKLSVGQKQLVSFARAVLADPQLFVMDEATSSVDTQTEQAIQKGLAAMLQGRISFIIAHRLSTIRAADQILVIADGCIIEAGTHHALIARAGQYYELYTRQFRHDREVEVLGAVADETTETVAASAAAEGEG